jgi:trans-aconitate methyltransferase
VAAELLLQRLPRGRLSAIDRSAAMIRAAEQRNRAAVVSGRARFLRLPFEEATLPFGQADRALAVNVNRFWLEPADESDRWGELLRPGATVALVYQPPSERSLTRVVDGCSEYLRLSRFSNLRVSRSPRLPAVCISASWA